VSGGVTRQEAAPREELPKNHAESVKICGNAAGRIVGDLGRDVAGLCEYDARDGLAAPVLTPRGTEIDQLDLTAVAHHHVLRAQIAVHDLERLAIGVGALVNVRQAFGHAHAERQRLGPADANAELPSSRSQVAEVPALDVLDHDVGLAADVGGRLENLRDARVGELRLNSRLVQKAGQKRAVLDVIGTDDLDDQRPFSALDAASGRQVDFPHAAASDAIEEREAFERTRQRVRRRLRRL
jgi:hypothetical protein